MLNSNDAKSETTSFCHEYSLGKYKHPSIDVIANKGSDAISRHCSNFIKVWVTSMALELLFKDTWKILLEMTSNHNIQDTKKNQY